MENLCAGTNNRAWSELDHYGDCIGTVLLDLYDCDTDGVPAIAKLIRMTFIVCKVV